MGYLDGRESKQRYWRHAAGAVSPSLRWYSTTNVQSNASKFPKMEIKYSFIFPAYNESERLTDSLPKVLDYVAQQQLAAEIIVVNDGSTDNTADVVRSFA